jgi:ABC-type multidrug transport system fused ATPase/permease subunit
MAIVPQDIFLFGGTIRENIAYGKTDATEEMIIDAARKANAWDFVTQFPDGLDTLVGERGTQLSGGQRQRIAIARAVLKNPRILILDEATSSLDSESERLVQDALEKLMKGRTSIVIAHRLSTIRQADHILVLDNGRIVEQGTHEQLLKVTDGLYRNLSELQFA